VAKAAVILGVMGELLGDAGIFEMSARLQILSDIKLNEASIRANNASIRALQGQLALLKILKPRNLSSDAQNRIVEKLKPLGPQPFMYSVSMAIEEGSDLPRQLGVLLIKDCSWQMYKQPHGRVLYRGMEGIGAAFGAGVIVTFDEKNPTLKKAAETLVEAVGDEGIAARAEPIDPNNPADNPAAIEIAIGTKPLFLREIETLLLGAPKL
jgi:hypothetical protein